jgi:hypothetical protein
VALDHPRWKAEVRRSQARMTNNPEVAATLLKAAEHYDAEARRLRR